MDGCDLAGVRLFGSLTVAFGKEMALWNNVLFRLQG